MIARCYVRDIRKRMPYNSPWRYVLNGKTNLSIRVLKN
jgi:hypothetical protein